MNARANVLPETAKADPMNAPVEATRIRRVAAPGIRAPGIPRRPETGPSPLSHAQEQLWFFQQLEPQSPLYNIPAAFHLRGPLQIETLRRAFTGIVHRHHSLRTRFISLEGTPGQTIAPPTEFPLPVMEIPAKAESQTAEADRLIREELMRPFDLSQDTLIRARVVRISETEHYLAISTHHIIADGWSMEVLFRELGEYYTAISEGRAPALNELPIQFADYAAWQRDPQQAASAERALAYWKEHVAGAPHVLELPTDHPRPASMSYSGDWVTRELPEQLGRDLKILSQREGATLFMTLLAAFAALLHRYTHADDFLVGVPVAGRNRLELENLVGFFVNTLALRIDVTGNPSFRELLDRVRDVTLGAMEHQELPFDQLVHALRPDRNSSHTPLIQTMFSFQSGSGPALKLPGVTITPLTVDRFHTGTAKFDLTFQIQPTRASLLIAAEYDTSIFERDTIERMLAHYEVLLAGMAARPACELADLPILTATEQHALVTEWNDTDSSTALEKNFADLFTETVDRGPERTAVRFAQSKITYKELDEQTNQIARALRARGVGRGHRVGLRLNRSIDLVAAAVGILKSGAAYVPLDIALPLRRMEFIANDANLSLIVTSSDLAPVFESFAVDTLLLDEHRAEIATLPATRLPVDEMSARDIDPVYLIHTSGSTGQPKGVLISHRSLANFLASMSLQPGLAPNDCIVAVTTISFDIAALELYLPLIVGATVVVASRDEAMDGLALRNLLDQNYATIMQATPVTWRLLVDAGWKPRLPFKALMGGEPMPKDLAEELIARGVELWNMYGPTETTVWSSCARIYHASAPITVGKPIANTQMLILDERRHVCPIGVPGELFIGGEGVALGYWNRPELTTERFIPNVFGKKSGDRLYCTGDLARWRRDGSIELLGRADSQVKIRGYRVELGEIEHAIRKQPGMHEVAVVLRPDSAGGNVLAAYITADGPAAELARELRNQLRTILPDYMIPSHFVRIDAMPRTPNGKLDRKALPKLQIDDVRPAQAQARPQSATEKLVLAAFSEILGRTTMGMNDDFFEMGGHSFMASKLVYKLRARIGVDVPLRLLFEHPTPAGMAEALETLLCLSPAHPSSTVAEQREELVI